MISEKYNTRLDIRENREKSLNEVKNKKNEEENLNVDKSKKKLYPLEKTIDDMIANINILLQNEVKNNFIYNFIFRKLIQLNLNLFIIN